MSVPTSGYDSSRSDFQSDFSAPSSSQPSDSSGDYPQNSPYGQNPPGQNNPYAGTSHTDSASGGYSPDGFATSDHVNGSPYSQYSYPTDSQNGYSSAGGHPGGFGEGGQGNYQNTYGNPQIVGNGIPAGYRPVYGQPGVFLAPNGTYYTQKSRTVAGILGILLGGLGIHRFYLGHIGIGIIQLVLSIVTFGLAALWGFIEGIIILCSPSTFPHDAKGFPLL